MIVYDVFKRAMLGAPKDMEIVCSNVLNAYKYDVANSAIDDRPLQYLRWFNLVRDMHTLLLINSTAKDQLIEEMQNFITSLRS